VGLWQHQPSLLQWVASLSALLAFGHCNPGLPVAMGAYARRSSGNQSAGAILHPAQVCRRVLTMLKEFKEFAMKGNVLDLAIGVIIGGAFGTIISSMVDDVIMPIIGAIFGGLDFSNYFLGLSSAVDAGTLEAAREQGAVLAYGSFITAVVNFTIIAFILFSWSRALTR
jgi:large conductance mechanosensitive channel